MSCDTLNRTALQLSVAVASLPEGFCPASMQELANAIGARLIISPSTDFNTFAIGSTAPQSNVGPWLKDCTEWFVFDDATATYVPENSTNSGGFKTQEYHTSSGTFTVPDFIFKIEVELWGGGGGGGIDLDTTGSAGGSAGGYVLKLIDVTPGQMIPYVIGAGGAQGAAGGNSTFLTLTAGGGPAGTDSVYGLDGGTAAGGDVNIKGQGGLNGSSGFGGTGGSSPRGGGGGVFTTPQNTTIQNGRVPGGGGSGDYGASISDGGAGASGAVLIRY